MEDHYQAQLIGKLIEAIKEQPLKRISFYQYMKMVLYFPELGYYTKNKRKIGKEADFYTSSSVGSVFGQTIANLFVELLPNTLGGDNYNILEIGGGNGRLARDILDELKNNHHHIYHKLTFYMLEKSPYHKNLQSEYLKEHLDHIEWIDSITQLAKPFNGIIFSNELIDSFPVHKVKKIDGELREVYVTWNEEEDQFVEVIDSLSDKKLNEYFIEQGINLKEGQIAEVNSDAVQWITDISSVLNKGYLLTIDYGYPADELYASHRHEGTLMCYYHHVANDNLYQNIGMQDITSHVNFTALVEYGESLGFEKVWLTTQSDFLIKNGILQYLTEIGLEQLGNRDMFHDKDLKKNRAIRHLITPEGMGETFKVLLQQKNIKKKDYRFLIGIWD